MKRLALVLVTACGHAAPAPTNTAPPDPTPVAPRAAHAQVTSTCGPTDGPASSLVVTPDAIACGQEPSGESLRIEVWSGGRSGTVDLASEGHATRCPVNGDCIDATGGTLDWGDDTHAARYELTFPDGSNTSGTLTLESCESPPMMCG